MKNLAITSSCPPPSSVMPELLLPVGNRQMCQAAIHNGADAVYIGVPGFNARGRGQDFSLDELTEMIDLCHLYGVKVHLALNVLIFEQELASVQDLLLELIKLGPDAFIIQDVGLAMLVRQLSPDMVIHGSTQMTVTNFEAIELLQDLAINRFVLGREVSMNEMAVIRQQTEKELEVFVHGALCVAYSGQCFTSEGIGGRSANRGQCAQSCRLQYDLIVDGKKQDLGEKRYLVSPQDLCGIDEVEKLTQLGINSFKVEGRLKTPEYVAQTGQAYTLARTQALSQGAKDSLKHQLALTYSRGFFSGWLNGVDHQQLVSGTYSAHRGIIIGEVQSDHQGKKRKNQHQGQNQKLQGKITLTSSVPLSAGQGLLFVWQQQEGKTLTTKQVGAKIATVMSGKQAGTYAVSLWNFLGNAQAGQQQQQFHQQKIPTGAEVYLNSDPQLDKKLQQSYQSRQELKKIPVNMRVTVQENNHLQLVLSDGENQVVVQAAVPLAPAANSPLSFHSLQEVFSQLGGTCFELMNLSVDLPGDFFLHQRELKSMRQEATSQLVQRRMLPRAYQISMPVPFQFAEPAPAPAVSEPVLNILLRKKEQVLQLIELIQDEPGRRQNLGDVILDFEFGKDYLPSVSALKAAGLSVGIATNRILRPKEYHHLKVIERLQPDMILIRNLGALHYFAQNFAQNNENKIRLHGDFSLNATNHLTYKYLLGKGLTTLCASYDLSASQLKDLIRTTKTAGVEVTLHQYLPLFHMEHCVFAAFLSQGHSFRDCGKPCEKHRVELQDAYGNTHHLKADQECRNTMFQGKAQSAATLAQDLIQQGVQHFRLELLDEQDMVLTQKIRGYLDLMAKKGQAAPELMAALGQLEHYGINEGTLAMERVIPNRKKA